MKMKSIKWEGKELTLTSDRDLDMGFTGQEGVFKPTWKAYAMDKEGHLYLLEWEYNPFGYSDKEIAKMPDTALLGCWHKPKVSLIH